MDLLLLSLTTLLLFTSPILAADPDPLQDFCVADITRTDITINGYPCKPSSTIVSEDFFSEAIATPGDTDNRFGSAVTSLNVTAFPALNTLGVAFNRVDLAPGGLNPPHVHPRATELFFVVEGEVLIGFISTLSTNSTFFSKVVKRGMNFIAPRGFTHFEFNVGESKALIITAFDSQLAGTLPASSLFGSTPAVPDLILTKTFQVSEEIIQEIKSQFGN